MKLVMMAEVPEDHGEMTNKNEIRRIHVTPRSSLYLPFDVCDCPVDPKFLKDTRTTFMSTMNDDGSTQSFQ